MNITEIIPCLSDSMLYKPIVYARVNLKKYRNLIFQNMHIMVKMRTVALLG